MKKQSPVIYEHGLAIPARCWGCPAVGRIVDAALAEMRPHQNAQREVMKSNGLTDLSIGDLWMFRDAQAKLSVQLAPLGIAIKDVLFTAQTDIDNLSRNCPGNGHHA